MTKTKGANFWLGFWLGAALCVLIWYWQKSTSADEGALNLLDELAHTQAKLHTAQMVPDTAPEPAAAAKPTAQPQPVAAPDDLTVIRGIGPVYARRLQEAGVRTYADMAAQTPEKVAQIVGLRDWQAASPVEWIAAAQSLAEASRAS